MPRSLVLLLIGLTGCSLDLHEECGPNGECPSQFTCVGRYCHPGDPPEPDSAPAEMGRVDLAADQAPLDLAVDLAVQDRGPDLALDDGPDLAPDDGPDLAPDQGPDPDMDPDQGPDPDMDPDQGPDPDMDPDQGPAPDMEPDLAPDPDMGPVPVAIQLVLPDDALLAEQGDGERRRIGYRLGPDEALEQVPAVLWFEEGHVACPAEPSQPAFDVDLVRELRQDQQLVNRMSARLSGLRAQVTVCLRAEPPFDGRAEARAVLDDQPPSIADASGSIDPAGTLTLQARTTEPMRAAPLFPDEAACEAGAAGSLPLEPLPSAALNWQVPRWLLDQRPWLRLIDPAGIVSCEPVEAALDLALTCVAGSPGPALLGRLDDDPGRVESDEDCASLQVADDLLLLTGACPRRDCVSEISFDGQVALRLTVTSQPAPALRLQVPMELGFPYSESSRGAPNGVVPLPSGGVYFGSRGRFRPFVEDPDLPGLWNSSNSATTGNQQTRMVWHPGVGGGPAMVLVRNVTQGAASVHPPGNPAAALASFVSRDARQQRDLLESAAVGDFDGDGVFDVLLQERLGYAEVRAMAASANPAAWLVSAPIVVNDVPASEAFDPQARAEVLGVAMVRPAPEGPWSAVVLAPFEGGPLIEAVSLSMLDELVRQPVAQGDYVALTELRLPARSLLAAARGRELDLFDLADAEFAANVELDAEVEHLVGADLDDDGIDEIYAVDRRGGGWRITWRPGLEPVATALDLPPSREVFRLPFDGGDAVAFGDRGAARVTLLRPDPRPAGELVLGAMAPFGPKAGVFGSMGPVGTDRRRGGPMVVTQDPMGVARTWGYSGNQGTFLGDLAVLEGPPITAIALADATGDGTRDLLLARNGELRVFDSVRLENGGRGLVPNGSRTVSLNGAARFIAVANLNDRGRPDVVAVHPVGEAATDTLTWVRMDGVRADGAVVGGHEDPGIQASFELGTQATGLVAGHVGGWPTAVAAVRFAEPALGQVTLYTADGEGLRALGDYALEAGEQVVQLQWGGGPPKLVSVRSLGDAGLTLTALDFSAGRVARSPGSVVLPEAQWPVFTGDLDDDGRNELVYRCADTEVCVDRVIDGVVGRWQRFALPGPLRFAEVADHDQDQRSDLLVVVEGPDDSTAAGLINWAQPE